MKIRNTEELIDIILSNPRATEITIEVDKRIQKPLHDLLTRLIGIDTETKNNTWTLDLALPNANGAWHYYLHYIIKNVEYTRNKSNNIAGIYVCDDNPDLIETLVLASLTKRGYRVTQTHDYWLVNL